jgi:hypothetical protein
MVRAGGENAKTADAGLDMYPRRLRQRRQDAAWVYRLPVERQAAWFVADRPALP